MLAADPSAAAGPAAHRPAASEWDGDAASARRAPPRRRADPRPLLFFDLETTGLSGGAGTLAFLVGCGYFEDDGFHTLQYFLSGYEAEHELLAASRAS